MANPHFGEIGDVWKHLALAEILASERPRQYMESHAGSAAYLISHSVPRDYGVFYLLENADRSGPLRESRYVRLLRALADDGTLSVYPGSPGIAMWLLRDRAERFFFCDVDAAAIASIRDRSRELEIADDRVETVQGDGVPAVAEAAVALPAAAASEAAALIDPFRPYVRSRNGLNPIELFAELATRGVCSIFWYAYDSQEERGLLHDHVRRASASTGYPTGEVWYGEIHLVGMENPLFDVDPGVLGCGIACANLSDASIPVVDRLGRALAEIYEGAVLPGGHSGAIRFGGGRLRYHPR